MFVGQKCPKKATFYLTANHQAALQALSPLHSFIIEKVEEKPTCIVQLCNLQKSACDSVSILSKMALNNIDLQWLTAFKDTWRALSLIYKNMH